MRHPLALALTALLAFAAPANAATHGDVVSSRSLTGAAALKSAGKNQFVLYRSVGIHNKPVTVSGVISVPKGKAPKGGWPIITWAHGTTGMADRCAPSKAVAGPQLLNRWVKDGFAVVRTDYEGLGTAGVHPYLNGDSEGHATLDIVRAARKLDKRLSKRVVISGHSQGGQAALFAGHLAARRAPGLRLRGVAAFAPASHVGDLARALLPSTATSPVSGYGALVIAGAAAASPRVRLGRIESPAALGLRPLVDRRCLQDLERPGEFGGLSPAQLVRPGADLRPLYRVLDAENPARRIPAPVRLFQGAADTTVPRPLTDRLAGELRRRGDRLRATTYAGVDHVGVVAAAATPTRRFLRRRLR
jgi:dienelactone hydrolase